MATINSSTVSYAQPSDLFLFYDLRTVADLASDTGTRIGGSPNPNPTTLAANTNVLAALWLASGWLEAACLRSNRYFPADLLALATVAPQVGQPFGNVSQMLLKRIVCAIAMGEMWKRRPRTSKAPEFYVESMKMLEDLANGERLFSFEENEVASIPSAYVEQPADVWQRGLVAQQACRYFGATGDVLWPQGWGWPGCGCD